MSEIQEKNYSQMKSFVDRNHWANTEKAEANCKRIDVQNGKFTCVVKVYETGTVQVQGAESKLREALLNRLLKYPPRARAHTCLGWLIFGF